MRYDFFPDREADMLTFGRNLARMLQERVGHFGLPAERVADFVERQRAFEEAYALAASPETRTRGHVARKNDARRRMESAARSLSRSFKGMSDLDDRTRVDLGFNVPRPRRGHVAPPGEAPVVLVVGVEGSDLMIALGDAARAGTRARPDDATGAVILYAPGEAAPLTSDGWRLGMTTAKKRVRLTIPGGLPAGTPVWICACWHSRRNENGPWSRPIQAYLARPLPDFGLIGAASATEEQPETTNAAA